MLWTTCPEDHRTIGRARERKPSSANLEQNRPVLVVVVSPAVKGFTWTSFYLSWSIYSETYGKSQPLISNSKNSASKWFSLSSQCPPCWLLLQGYHCPAQRLLKCRAVTAKHPDYFCFAVTAQQTACLCRAISAIHTTCQCLVTSAQNKISTMNECLTLTVISPFFSSIQTFNCTL